MTRGEPAPAETTTESQDDAEHRVVAAILSGSRRPGDPLDPRDFAAGTDAGLVEVERALLALVRDRLVETSADGGFRVATPAPDDYDHALQVLFGFAELAVRWSVPTMDDADVAILAEALEQVRDHVAGKDPVGLGTALDDLVGPLLTATPNPFFEHAAVTVLTQCQFLALAQPRFVFWGVGDFVDSFRAALRGRDGDAAADGVRALGRAVLAHVEEQRASGPPDGPARA
ncbi:GntR family transcriptional regulator [Curtobacterium sp. 22159]|uniref:GntR family transcriptional regulator n=1 Tax=Curtobacterium sp. 22159 TaxID=3453882 RepID=UPI003F85FB40